MKNNYSKANLEKNLRSCMSCRFFGGSSRQCIAERCVEEEESQQIVKEEKKDECFECPYRQSERYCFPCMKKILGLVEHKNRITDFYNGGA